MASATRSSALAVLLAGLVSALGQAPVSVPWAALLGLGLAFWLLSRIENVKRAAWLGWFYGLGYFAAALFWIVEPFMVDIARHGWMAPFALIGMAGGLALFWALAFGTARWLARGGWALAFSFAFALSSAEMLRSYIFTGFPWALIGHVWIGWAPMQLAAWIGPHGLTFLTVLLPALLVIGWHRKRAVIAMVLSPFALCYGAAVWFAAQPVPVPSEPKTLRLIQPNAPQHLKWHPDHVRGFFERQVAYTAAPSETRPDLIIWPETSVPTWLDQADGAFSRIAQAAAGVPVVLGIQRSEKARVFNSLVVLGTDGQVADIYDKHHLVPFGEYIPLLDKLGALPFGALVADHAFGYSPGPGARLLDMGALGKALPLICYEAIFPQDVNAAPGRPDWLLQITNDAWFGKLTGPYQHLAQARLRAVEQGLPMVRVANTGVSAVIDPRGQIVESIGLGQAGYLDATLPGTLPPTLYARSGDWAALALLLMLGLVLWGHKRKAGLDIAIDLGNRDA